MHCNFSTDYIRDTGGKEYFLKLIDKFEEYKDEHVAAYGPDNHMRLTGLHETQSIDKFSWGVAGRGASIRVPHGFVKDDAYRGYLEDRRPKLTGRPLPNRLSRGLRQLRKSKQHSSKPHSGYPESELHFINAVSKETAFFVHSLQSEWFTHPAITESRSNRLRQGPPIVHGLTVIQQERFQVGFQLSLHKQPCIRAPLWSARDLFKK